ncbi:peptide ABC transporter ATP-binding protein [Devosia pacifica]|uniref:Peptide ABC transporter ATP-binding protein n=1 Tax=Devosia pacifica TaxID=1335967 RepID=A0A918SEB6_9HYPH|nr:DMT family transporter [Devosia pacifica]GHA34453.1 peptide ABC transporter ATP-binding protein [Devosia pacifica]
MLVRTAPALFLVLWASGFAFAKLGLEHAAPLTLLSLRFGIIVVLFVVIAVVMRPPLPKAPVEWLHLVAVGFLIQSVYFGLAYAGMSLGVSAGIAAVIASTQPLIVGLAAPLVTSEHIGRLKWAGLLLGAIGAVLVVIGADRPFDSALDVGLFLCAGSAFGMAAATLYQKRFPVAAHPVTVNLVHYVVGFVTITPFALSFETTPIDWGTELAVALAWLVVANSLIAVSLLLFMIRQSEASRVSALFFLVPPVAALISWLVMGETMTPMAIIGMVVAVIGVGLVTRRA